MRVLKVYTKTASRTVSYLYHIYEDDENGALYWKYTELPKSYKGPFLQIFGTGSLSGSRVTLQQAKQLTGIDDECAMDRLREMLHESEEVVS